MRPVPAGAEILLMRGQQQGLDLTDEQRAALEG